MVATYTETHPPVLGRPGNLHNGEHFCAETSGSNYLTKIGGAAPSDVRYTEGYSAGVWSHFRETIL